MATNSTHTEDLRTTETDPEVLAKGFCEHRTARASHVLG